MLEVEILVGPFLERRVQPSPRLLGFVVHQVDDVRVARSEACGEIEIVAFLRFAKQVRKTFRELVKPAQEKQGAKGPHVDDVELPGDSGALLPQDLKADP